MNRGFIARWTRMPHSIGRLSDSASSHHNLSSAAFITNIQNLIFGTHTIAFHERAQPRLFAGDVIAGHRHDILPFGQLQLEKPSWLAHGTPFPTPPDRIPTCV
jgi:hypothetical protein